MTHRMFDTDVMRKRCTATVTACSPRKKGYGILLDQTVFFHHDGLLLCWQKMIGLSKIFSQKKHRPPQSLRRPMLQHAVVFCCSMSVSVSSTTFASVICAIFCSMAS